ncbi:vWA domain-containing protein [Nocardia brasiliensis]|uniref:vWA domain-containing protein n=1 Tax=Nocardia brasiliensis TaxID=37326 RepID=UPI0024569C02|nr:VWA domain-containing protein [Nocardia brasiliensis]
MFDEAGDRDELYPIVPILIIVDCSGSMQSVIGNVNKFIPRLIGTMAATPEAQEAGALGIIEFNTKAETRRKLTWLDNASTQDRFEACGKTNYSAPLELARKMLVEQAPQLGRSGYRPVIFFITDGNHNVVHPQKWIEAHAALVSLRCRPRILAFGFGAEINLDTLKLLATNPELASLADRAKAETAAIEEILTIVLNTVVSLTVNPGGYEGFAARILRDEMIVPYGASGDQ